MNKKFIKFSDIKIKNKKDREILILYKILKYILM